MTSDRARRAAEAILRYAKSPAGDERDEATRSIAALIDEHAGVGELESDAATLRGFINTYKMTPTMMVGERDTYREIANRYTAMETRFLELEAERDALKAKLISIAPWAELRARLDAVVALHAETGQCARCGMPAPCPTVRAARGER